MLNKFLKYILQSVAGMIGVSVYILADTFFISVYSGANGLAVLNLILPVYGLIYATGSMIGIGSATRYSIKNAQGENTDYFFGQSIMWSMLISIPLILAGVFIPDKILAVLGADTKLIELGYNYLKIVLIASPFFMSNYTFTAFSRNDKATSTALIGLISGSIFNIVFDYIFMFLLNIGFPGAALATALSPIVTMAICCTHYLGKNNNVGFAIRMPSIRHIILCCKLGISAFMGEISSAVITIVFNMLILKIAGNIGVAAYGVIANMSIVAMSIFNGLAQGSQPLISESYGRGDTEQVKKLFRWGICASIITQVVTIAYVWIKTDYLVNIFNSENNLQLIKYAHIGLRLYFLGFLFAGINIIMVAYFSATDNAKISIVGSAMRGTVAIVVSAIVLAGLFGLNGVWMAFFCSETITFFVIIFMSCKQRMRLQSGKRI